jgi:hypothetical protein
MKYYLRIEDNKIAFIIRLISYDSTKEVININDWEVLYEGLYNEEDIEEFVESEVLSINLKEYYGGLLLANIFTENERSLIVQILELYKEKGS